MYSRDEAKKIKESFWTTFGMYMSPVPSADGQKATWMNYKTGIRYLFFRMAVNNKVARIGVEIANPDPGIRSLIFEQFKEFRAILEDELEEEWIWEEISYDEFGKATAQIYTEKSGVSVFKKEHWPELISFFKPRIIALDSFWSAAQYGFDLFK